jgi:hypothetical protein
MMHRADTSPPSSTTTFVGRTDALMMHPQLMNVQAPTTEKSRPIKKSRHASCLHHSTAPITDASVILSSCIMYASQSLLHHSIPCNNSKMLHQYGLDITSETLNTFCRTGNNLPVQRACCCADFVRVAIGFLRRVHGWLQYKRHWRWTLNLPIVHYISFRNGRVTQSGRCCYWVTLLMYGCIRPFLEHNWVHVCVRRLVYRRRLQRLFGYQPASPRKCEYCTVIF